MHKGPRSQQRGAPCIKLTFLQGVQGTLVAVLLVVLAAGAGAAQGGQEQEADPQRGAAHLQQVRGCGTAGGCFVPARPAART